jgi:hypothetical protein
MPKRYDRPAWRIAARKKRNEQKPCDVPSCPRNRYQVSRYCVTHNARYRAYGHPKALMPRSLIWVPSFRAIYNLLKVNAFTHKGVLLSLTKMSKDCRKQMVLQEHHGYLFRDYRYWLARHSVRDPIVSLALAGSPYLMDILGPDKCSGYKFYNATHRDRVAANLFARGYHKNRQKGGSDAPPAVYRVKAKRQLAEYLFSNYGNLLYNLASTIIKGDQDAIKLEQAQEEDLATDISQTVRIDSDDEEDEI